MRIPCVHKMWRSTFSHRIEGRFGTLSLRTGEATSAQRHTCFNAAILLLGVYSASLIIELYKDIYIQIILLLSESEGVSHSAVSDSLRPHGLQFARLLCAWGFSRREYWSGLPFTSPEDLPDPESEPRSLVLQANSLPSEPENNQNNQRIWLLSILSQNWKPHKNSSTGQMNYNADVQ